MKGAKIDGEVSPNMKLDIDLDSNGTIDTTILCTTYDDVTSIKPNIMKSPSSAFWFRINGYPINLRGMDSRTTAKVTIFDLAGRRLFAETLQKGKNINFDDYSITTSSLRLIRIEGYDKIYRLNNSTR
jgi:hypothetical protein